MTLGGSSGTHLQMVPCANAMCCPTDALPLLQLFFHPDVFSHPKNKLFTFSLLVLLQLASHASNEFS